jgi:hypothetical protein
MDHEDVGPGIFYLCEKRAHILGRRLHRFRKNGYRFKFREIILQELETVLAVSGGVADECDFGLF